MAEIRLDPLLPWHMAALRLQPFQALHEGAPSPASAVALARLGPARAVVRGLDVLAVGGLAECWPGRAAAWCYLSRDAGFVLARLSRLALKELAEAPYARIEAYADAGFPQAHRWLGLLGFALEAPRLKGFLPGGRDGSLFARVQEDLP